MRQQAITAEDPGPGVVAAAPWRVTAVRVVGEHRLEVRFVDGTAGEVDLSRLITGDRAGVFAALRDPEVFGRVGLEHGAVVWPGELDLAPDAMHDAIRAHGRWIVD